MNKKPTYFDGLCRRKVLKYGLSGAFAASLSPLLWVSGCGKKEHRKKPSIFLITIDTLRADHLGCYGYSKNTSPNIDQFADEALLFENCLSHASDTLLSFSSILTGFLPHETRSTEKFFLPVEVKTLAEILQEQGYKTMAVISNYVLRKKQGYDQGFMIYDDTMNQRELVREWPERTAEHTTNRAIELLKEFHNDQLFMWIHYQDPHGPYTPPESFATLFRNPRQKPLNIKLNTSPSGRGGIPSYQVLDKNTDYYHYVSQYDGEIRYQDEHFKRLVEALKQFGLYDDSLLILSSDHGEGMGEHDYFFAHRENLYNSLTHVPLVIKYGNQLTGRRTDFVQHIDIFPTVLKVLGLKVDSRFRGRDLRSQHGTNREIFAEMILPAVWGGILVQFSLAVDGLKLIYTPQNERYEMFNLKTDRGEEHNLITDYNYVERFKDLNLRLIRICNEDFLKLRIVNEPSDRLTEEELEKLKSLGYIR